MNVNLTLLGQYMFIHVAVLSALTFLYSRRKDMHSVGASVLVIFAWILPILGPVCLAAFLAERRKPRTIEAQMRAKPLPKNI